MFSAPSDELACGLFNAPHLISSLICIFAVLLLFVFLRKISDKSLQALTRGAAILLTALETVKIIFKFSIGEGGIFDHWVPLFYCSLFIYALLILAFIKNESLKKAARTFLTLGCAFSGLTFLIFPTTSLPDYPIYHFISLHSMLFHSLMMLLGLLYMYKGYEKPSKDSYMTYAIFVCAPVALSLVLNPNLESNFMLLGSPVNMPLDFVSAVYNFSPIIYRAALVVIYLTVPYFADTLIYLLIKKSKR